jgi:hypothetical protein
MGAACWSPLYPPCGTLPPREVLLDSGAYSDQSHEHRLTFSASLERQLNWEKKAQLLWGDNFRVGTLVAYDFLLNHDHLSDASQRIDITIQANHYLASQRDFLAPRRLCFPIQGSQPSEYVASLEAILCDLRAGDVLGLGGWCIIGRRRTMLPDLEETCKKCLPLARERGVKHCHIFGVLWLPALYVVEREALKLGMTTSTDSAGPVMAFHSFSGSHTKGQRNHQALTRWWRKRLLHMTEDADYKGTNNDSKSQ